MLGKTHIVATGAIITTYYVSFPLITNHALLDAGIATACACLGAIIPDCDTKNSLINKILPFKLYRHFKHRGFMHTLIGLFCFSLIIGIICLPFNNSLINSAFTALILGYFLHLVEDSFSLDGINWFYPFTDYDQYIYHKYHRLARKVNHYVNHVPIRHWWGHGMKVGGKIEKTIFWFSIVVIIINLVKIIINRSIFLIL